MLIDVFLRCEKVHETLITFLQPFACTENARQSRVENFANQKVRKNKSN